ncbi:trypsin-like serine peptidase [Streptomyces sp. NPDC059443]|uniref:trypsin-like serine peptidase n=1 Tax=unclassified Streptomyces TaxID=2593676 RepID=UPI003674E05A
MSLQGRECRMFTKVQIRAVRVFVLSGICCALLVGGAGYVWQLRGLAAYVAQGDPGRGTYLRDPASTEDAATAVLNGAAGAAPDAGAPDAGAPDAGGPPAPAPATGETPDGQPLTAAPAPAEPAVGALFSPGDDADPDHHCSASVVHSPGGDLIATAAHCVYRGGFRTNLAFAPGYRDGSFPYGVWVPDRIDVDPRWIEDHDPDRDVAFLRLSRPGHPGERLEDTTGSAETIRFGTELPVPARLMGYPNDSEEPLGCLTTAVAAGPTQVRLDCADVPNGTSGGPVLADGHTLIGVIGGRDLGGDDETSYSSYFDDGIRDLYLRAVGG